MHTFSCEDCDAEFEKKNHHKCKDGKHRCEKCIDAISDKKSYQKHREARLKKQKKYHLNNKEKRAESGRQWYLKNKEAIAVYNQKYHKKNKEALNKKQKVYLRTDKGRASKARTSSKRYWADPEYYRKKSVAKHHGVTLEFIASLEQACQLCGTKEKLTIDHMHPVSHGGKGVKGNLQILCGSCNSWKSDRLFLANGSGYLIGV